MQNEFSYLGRVDATIAAGAALSAPVRLSQYGITRIGMPTAWTAAALTFLVSEDNVTYRELYDNLGNEVSVAAAAGQSVSLDPTIFGLGFQYVQLRSGTLATPVDQAAAAVIELAIRPI